ncbi:hypothetical protein [Desulfosporosinus sp. BICA1-9]|uniref:hypothetical protein n=1 Tax=Desulfosporosinus sp. BICA1-9 TaxID=1531958 RepID=UPI00054BBF49|nr:hypothetical protein [Desulfosporosinus sp. BICA1-9]KJS50269.1 MAG: hypothetical protein VR66_03665 [Peptococcaceae bacterium BRH_c23]KJS85106.1 MAG: hypothetical protein JL57_19875 [Desulfosporosinus sp. BICA1-9]HBW34072.1 hypothetical protein [Desulfosporosinus sp.]
MLERKSYEISELYEKINLIMGVSYGSEGIIPCHRCCDNNCCISDSGDVLCGGYMEHSEVTETVTGAKLYVVKCHNAVEFNL